MATLLTARGLTKYYNTHTLFSGIDIALADKDRLGLIGPNGSGKSTLLKILAELCESDAGEIIRRKNLNIAYVAQDDLFPPDITPLNAVVQSLESQAPGQDTQDTHGLDPTTRAQIALSRIGFVDNEKKVGILSGGWRKRLSVACAIARDPHILFLDEPTNHLDLEGVLWLEHFVKQADMAVVFITHDRTFLEGSANRIIELSAAYPDGAFEVKGNYTEFVRRKEDFLDAQLAQQTAVASKVRRDTAWLKQGIQGRQTRNKTQVASSRDRQAELKTLQDRNAATGKSAGVDFQASGRKTHKLLDVENVAKSLGDKKLFDHLTFTLSPGMCLGLLGPNGSGKTTLMRLLTGELKPDRGTVKPATNLRIVNFTQHREDLNPTDTLRQALCPVGDTVYFGDKSMHVSAWAKTFLFDPTKFRTPVANLSGGEQARILIARLMQEPADLLILDEPTNDLDIPTLEVLEDSLSNFPGAIVLVTHDRFMLGRLSTDLIAFDGSGGAKNYASYEQWESNRNRSNQSANQTKPDPTPTPTPTPTPIPAPDLEKPNPRSSEKTKPASTDSKKLTFKLQHELENMEPTILEAESELARLQALADDPKIIADHTRYTDICIQLGDAQTRVTALYDRWSELESM